ncbi:GntR family transcriptional regulator [Desulfopila sp. IMCC35008]|uniref:GntR family transcriptional regulator n=1 Tax=Desulfopila sp. IMCC35008 TaxID=2653858 RepID=UPI0013CFFF23|nr:GntR family transcriptional regulator [Desulfopila sp. IMCC35008]
MRPELQFSSLSEQVYRYLRTQMSEGNLLPGATINLGAIAAQLGISKTPLRDALIQLESDGFVTIIPRRGVRVNKLSTEDIREAYEAVGLVESFIIEEFIEHITPGHIQQLEELNAKMINNLTRKDFQDLYDDNLEFHSVYTDLSTNSLLKKFISQTKLRLDDFRRRNYIRRWGEKNCHEHTLLIDFLKKKDGSGAATYLRDVHWSFAAEKPFFERIQAKNRSCSCSCSCSCENDTKITARK